MKVGDSVRLKANHTITGIISRLPSNSAKRKRARVAVQDEQGAEIWLYIDEIEANNAT